MEPDREAAQAALKDLSLARRVPNREIILVDPRNHETLVYRLAQILTKLKRGESRKLGTEPARPGAQGVQWLEPC